MNTRLTTRPLAERDRPSWDELWAISLAFSGEDDTTARHLYDRVATRSPYVRYEIALG